MGIFAVCKKMFNNKKNENKMETIIIKLDSSKLENPNLDIIYKLPEKIEEISNGTILDNGYDYISQTEIALFLETKSAENYKIIIDFLKKEKICDCDLYKSAEIYISKKENAEIEESKKVYPQV